MLRCLILKKCMKIRPVGLFLLSRPDFLCSFISDDRRLESPVF